MLRLPRLTGYVTIASELKSRAGIIYRAQAGGPGPGVRTVKVGQSSRAAIFADSAG